MGEFVTLKEEEAATLLGNAISELLPCGLPMVTLVCAEDGIVEQQLVAEELCDDCNNSWAFGLLPRRESTKNLWL